MCEAHLFHIKILRLGFIKGFSSLLYKKTKMTLQGVAENPAASARHSQLSPVNHGDFCPVTRLHPVNRQNLRVEYLIIALIWGLKEVICRGCFLLLTGMLGHIHRVYKEGNDGSLTV